MINASLMGVDCKHTSSQDASILTLDIVSMLEMDTEYDLNTMGGRVGYAIKKSGHTPSSVALEIDCEPQAISQWIHGPTKNIKNSLLFKLADLTGFEARWITLGHGPQKTQNIAGILKNQAIAHTVEVMKVMDTEQQYLVARLADQVAEPKKKNSPDQ